MKKISKVEIFSGSNPLMIVETKTVIIPFVYSFRSLHAIELPSPTLSSEDINHYIQKAIK